MILRFRPRVQIPTGVRGTPLALLVALSITPSAASAAAPPSHRGVELDSVAATPEAATRRVPPRPAGAPDVVPRGTRASGKALPPPASEKRRDSDVVRMPDVEPPPGSGSLRSVDRAPSPGLAPQPGALTRGSGPSAGSGTLAPPGRVDLSTARGTPPDRQPNRQSEPTPPVTPRRSIVLPEPEPKPPRIFDRKSGKTREVTPLPWDETIPPIPAPESLPTARDFESSMFARYKIEESLIRLEDDPDGVRGNFHLRGDLTPEAARAPEVVAQGPRAIAQAFLVAEAENLGIASLEDLHENGYSPTDIGWTSIAYIRYVGDLPLEYAALDLSIKPDGTIRSVGGSLVPLPRDLFAAAAQRTLSETDIFAIIAGDRIANGESPNQPIHLKLFATSSPPYVVWKGRGRWDYRIDAFTGEILDKRSGLRTIR